MASALPALLELKALDGRIVAMLTPAETAVLRFYRDQGRKFDVQVAIINEANPAELAAARSAAEADALMKSANSRVAISVGPSAEAAWAARCS